LRLLGVAPALLNRSNHSNVRTSDEVMHTSVNARNSIVTGPPKNPRTCESIQTCILTGGSTSPTWCKSTARIGGYHRWNSRTHWFMMVAGHMSRHAPILPLWCRPARYATTSIVFPSPISSPMIPPASCPSTTLALKKRFTSDHKDPKVLLGKRSTLAICVLFYEPMRCESKGEAHQLGGEGSKDAVPPPCVFRQ
jgi:hypothetical protein